MLCNSAAGPRRLVFPMGTCLFSQFEGPLGCTCNISMRHATLPLPHALLLRCFLQTTVGKAGTLPTSGGKAAETPGGASAAAALTATTAGSAAAARIDRTETAMGAATVGVTGGVTGGVTAEAKVRAGE